MRLRILLLCSAFSLLSAAAQTASAPPPLELDGTQMRPHPIGPQEVIRAADNPPPTELTALQRAWRSGEIIGDNLVSVELSVVVNLNGRVESATPIRGPQRFYAQAQQIEMHRAFEPVRDKDGTIVRAQFTDAVRVAPPERWSDHPVPFPQSVDRKTFRITLERTGCFGVCPGYTVAISGDGQVQWDGLAFVAAPGTHRATLPPETIDEVIDAVRSSRMLDARNQYRSEWTDSATYTLSLSINGLHKQVVDYIGIIVGMPSSIRELEDTVDRIAGTDKWITGNADLLPALRAEHWNFASSVPDNIRLYNSALQRDMQEVLQAFSSAHAPVFSGEAKVMSPVCTASAIAHGGSIVRKMMQSVPEKQVLPQSALNECLTAAARGGNLQLTDFWLERGASVVATPHEYSDVGTYTALDSPLLAAIQSGSPAVVLRLLDAKAPLDPAHNDGHNPIAIALSSDQSSHPEDQRTILQALLRAGVDPNEETDRDPSLFALISEPSQVPVLVAGGVNMNAVDRSGNRPLMTNVYLPVLKAMLEAGADPTLRNTEGQTAADSFRAEGLKEQADLIDAAIQARINGAATAIKR